ncbi:DUF1499 domain-containing protein [Aliidiomarina iranensis]|uniref:DUF1499 domain-containing protein n=1 Tax=Aliidiomarina iranensis TaxID=1434071 RepID=A0A432W1Z3_9GAMM|nr:DUF1499 domain-containing protein [Aliidiomarina iranensis]RUO23244.1 DUF1499 domain-containing protein [Aliidiomarina iranensis]
MKKLLCWLAGISGFAALFILFISGPLYRLEILGLGNAFLLMRWAAYIGIAAIVLVLLALVILRPSSNQHRAILGLSLILGFVSFYMPYNQLQTARSVPAIHDISTDTVNPPEFVAVAPLRADAPNPVEYAGPDVARQQLEAYPDIETMRFQQAPADVFAAALAVVQGTGWEIVAAEANDGRIEATVTTTWFGFKDDVVIRIQGDGGETLLDMRSKSRLGGSDVGANAARIREFRESLMQRMR